MPFFEIAGYRTEWSVEHSQGKIEVSFPKGGQSRFAIFRPSATFGFETVPVSITDVNEMALLLDMLRNEAPIFFDPNTVTFKTGSWEQTGEGE